MVHLEILQQWVIWWALWLKASGFLYHVYPVAETECDIYHQRRATSKLRGTPDDLSQSSEDHGSVDFSDSIISETYLLFLFCQFCLSFEQVVRKFGRCKGATAGPSKNQWHWTFLSPLHCWHCAHRLWSAQCFDPDESTYVSMWQYSLKFMTPSAQA